MEHSPTICEGVLGNDMRLLYPSTAAFYGLVIPLAIAATGLGIFRKIWPTASYKMYLYFLKGLFMLAELSVTITFIPSLINLATDSDSCASATDMMMCALVTSFLLAEYSIDILVRSGENDGTKVLTLLHHGNIFWFLPYVYLRMFTEEDTTVISAILPLLLILVSQHSLMFTGKRAWYK